MNEQAVEQESIDYESEAREQGWRPQEEWKGDPEKWKSAEQFVEDGKNILPIVNAKNSKLQGKVDDLAAQVAELRQTNQQFGEFSKKAMDRWKKETSDLRQELKARRKQAIDEGDGAAFENADQQLAELDRNDVPAQEIPPEAQAFVSKNPWYGADEEMTAFADGIADRLAGSGYQGVAYFNELEARAKKAFPHKFKNEEKGKPSVVETEGSQTKKDTSKKSFDNLPPEAKAACRQFQKEIDGFTEDQYLEMYDWE